MQQNVLTTSVTDEKYSPAQLQVAATAFLSLFSLVGLSFYGLPFFYDFFVKEYGWKVETVTNGNFYGKLIVGPLFGFLAGWMIERFGPRRLMMLGILMGGASLLGLSAATTVGMFYLCYLFNALGYVSGGPLPNQVLLSRWFDKARGRAMGFAYLGIGIGGALVPQLARRLTEWIGWHQALAVLGMMMIAIALPLVWFIKETPPGFTAAHQTAPVPLRPVLRSPYFYLLAIGSMCSIGAVGGINQHLKLFLTRAQDYSQAEAANIISLVLASSIAGRLLMGWLADRWPKKYVMLLIYLLVAAAIPLLYFVASPGMVYLFAVIFGIAFGGDYMIIPLMAAELFGLKVMGRVMGIVITADGVAEALAPKMVGRLYDLSQSYTKGFALLIGLAMIGAIAVALLPKSSKRDDY